MVAKSENRTTSDKRPSDKTFSRVTIRKAKPKLISEPESKSEPKFARYSSSTAKLRLKPAIQRTNQLEQETKSSRRPRRVLTPIPLPNIRRKEGVHPNHTTGKENRIRSALTTHSTVKSVRWDPAIVSCGPITPSPAPTPEFRENVSANSVIDPGMSHSDENGDGKGELTQTLRRLKTNEKQALHVLLNALKNIENEDEYSARPSSGYEAFNFEGESNSLKPDSPVQPFRKCVTLKAQIAQRKANKYLGKETLPIPRKRPHIRSSGLVTQHETQEPTWINIFNPPTNMSPGFNALADHGQMPTSAPSCVIEAPPSFNLPPYQVQNGQSGNCWNGDPLGVQASSLNGHLYPPFASFTFPLELPQQVWQPASLFPQYGLNEPPQLNHWVGPFSPPTLPLAPFPVPPRGPQPIHPCSRPPLTSPRYPVRSNDHRDPMVDVGLECVPSDDGIGREARAIERGWAKSLLAKFREKYPRTGRVKAGAPAPGQMRHAAAIQQRLEFILYQEKERSAGVQRSCEDPPPSYKKFENPKTASSVDLAFMGDKPSSIKVPDEATISEIVMVDESQGRGNSEIEKFKAMA